MAKKRNKSSVNIYAIFLSCVAVLIILTVVFYYFRQNKKTKIYEKAEFNHLNSFEVHGIDVSKHNGEIFWEDISKYTINDWELKFVFVRATYALADGSLKEDKCFDENWRQANNCSLIRGAYHFYSPAVSINKQIEMFKNEVKLTKGDLPPVIDVENFERGNIYISKKDIPKIETWLKQIESYYGVKPIIYTSKKMYLDYFKNDKFKKYYFWIANYGEKISDLDKHEWLFWQHSEEGKINNHVCNFDLNVFNGTEKDLDNICIH